MTWHDVGTQISGQPKRGMKQIQPIYNSLAIFLIVAENLISNSEYTNVMCPEQ